MTTATATSARQPSRAAAGVDPWPEDDLFGPESEVSAEDLARTTAG